jgi:hypothetical protein
MNQLYVLVHTLVPGISSWLAGLGVLSAIRLR